MQVEARVDPRVVERIRRLLRVHARREEVAELRAVIDHAHDNALRALAGDKRADLELSEFAWAKTALFAPASPLPMSLTATVTGNGELAGYDTYEKFDPGWLDTLAEYLDHITVRRPRFGRDPQRVDIPNQTSLAIAGDWATGYWQGGNTAASKVASVISSGIPSVMTPVDYAIHIGDTYYAGTPAEVSDHLVSKWPVGVKDSFAVPGNHEMYCKGKPFADALVVRFPSQQRTTFFALRNANWLVLALDTAYFAKLMYTRGTLGPEKYRRWLIKRKNEQREFARQQLSQRGTRRVILFTHHPPIELDGTGPPRDLEGEVLQLFGAHGLPGGPDYWAWGHIHGAVGYKKTLGRYTGRLIGHGAIPYGDASGLAGSPAVAWYEASAAGDPQYPMRVRNGFLRLDLDGPIGTEAFVAEDGSRPFTGPL